MEIGQNHLKEVLRTSRNIDKTMGRLRLTIITQRSCEIIFDSKIDEIIKFLHKIIF